MLIKSLKRIDAAAEKEVREVYLCCREYENLKSNIFLETELNFNQEMNSLFLLYDENKLVSFISMFMPRSYEAEITAYTLPQYRRRGYFKRLLSEATGELKKYNVKDILFVCEDQSQSGKEAIKRLGADYDFTEYFMRYDTSETSFDSGCEYKTHIYNPDISDLESLCQISMLVYDESYEEAESMIKSSLTSSNRKAYAAVLGDRLIGKGFAGFENGEVSINGLGILPEFQGKGYGKELLHMIMRDLLDNGHENITLEVDSKNNRAFELYKKSGFRVEIAIDYYRKTIE